jgi:hypothetical protein
MSTSHIAKPDMSKYPNLKAEFPHILDKMELLWGYKEFYVYVDSLTLQSRDRPRAGFSQAIVHELFNAEQDHQRWLPRSNRHDIWAVDNFAV